MAFHELHVEPLLEHTDAVWVVPVPRRSHDDDPMVGEDADPGGIDIYSTIEDCRHPFGLLNPPEKVWEAHRRLILGAAGPQDQELVDEFAVRNAYYGSGLGKRKDMSRRFVVRRSRYVGHLARERRIKKEIQSKRSEYQ